MPYVTKYTYIYKVRIIICIVAACEKWSNMTGRYRFIAKWTFHQKLNYDGKVWFFPLEHTNKPVISKAYGNKHDSVVLIKRELQERTAS